MSKINENTPLGVPQYIIDGWPINNDLKSPVNKAKGGYAPNVTTPAYPVQVPGSRQFSNKALLATLALVPLLPASLVGLSLGSYLLSFAVVALPTFALFNIACSWIFTSGKPQSTAGRPIGDYMTFRDPSLAAAYGNGRIPMEVFFEAYFDKKINIKMDCLALLENRHDWARFGITYGQLQFFLTQWIPETLWHSRKQDEDQVRDHYDRGDDFYAAFLGPAMIYTSGIIKDAENKESLEQLQYNKLELVCKKTQLKAGEKLLDIGCGWGSLAVHAADRYGVTATGVTLGRNQTKFATERATLRNVKDRVNILCMDYRDIPRTKYNKITCLEMAEHVGVRKFQEFLAQVSDLLEDDGLFFLQIAGLRRAWTYEDFIWGLFMAKYVFPGADASCPLGWVVDQLETAGFEVRDVETIGVHYSATIHRWYLNWMKNRETIVNKYGETWFRRWEFFLAYSTIIARQGSATCYQIVAHKNLNKFDRTVFV